MLSGESVDSLSREFGVEPYRLERWSDRALSGMEAGPKEREGDMLTNELDRAKKTIGRALRERFHPGTTNKGVAEWGDYLGDPTLAAALLDRFLHHCHVLNISGESFRLKEKARKSGGAGGKRNAGEQQGA